MDGPVDVLVIGSGGREHALCWKIAKSEKVDKVYCAPGNGGTHLVAENVPIQATDLDGLLSFAKEKDIGLTVVGPEDPLCMGIVDRFEAEGLLVFGPDQKSAEIEGSKAFCRDLCRAHHIPSPQSWIFSDVTKAYQFLEGHKDEKLVIKASGLAAGKGVMICENHDEARNAVSACLDKGSFGDSGATIVIEEFLTGQEVSILALSDGSTIVPLESAKDHKARFEGDKGPNTGGMGAISPAPAANPRTLKQTESQVLVQGIHALGQEGRRYKGILYAGIMVTPLGPRLLEFNCRFGDPETQPLMMRMKSDLVPFLVASARGDLGQLRAGPDWDPRPAACVVAVADGYPGPYEKGQRIEGIYEFEGNDDVMIFHAGTERRVDGNCYTAGGRVFAVTALGKTTRDALSVCYDVLGRVGFPGMGYRKDIGKRGAYQH